MKYYVLDTKEDSDKCRKKCWDAVIRVSGDANPNIQWSEELTRLTDGKYVVPYCQEFENELDSMDEAFEGVSAREIYGFPIETPNSDWFPEPEI